MVNALIEIWNKSSNAKLFTTVFLLVFIPPYIFMLDYPELAPFKFFANDSFYYFNLIKNSHAVNFYSYDGVYPTNGFHPIWGNILFFLNELNILDISNKVEFLKRVFILNLFILSLATSIFALFSTKYFTNKWWTIVMFAPGISGILLSPIAADYLTTWSYVNGMETAIALLFFSISLMFYSHRNKNYIFLFLAVLFMGLTVLSRLDEIFFFISFFVLLMINSKPHRRIYTFAYFIPPALLILGYLAYNQLTVGILMPISGWEKSGFSILGNLKIIIKLFLPIYSWDYPNVLRESHVLYSTYTELFMRMFQLIVPLVIAIIYLGYYYYKLSKTIRFSILHALVLGVILKALYNLIFVGIWRQGSWYFGSSIFITNLLLTVGLSIIFESLFHKKHKIVLIIKHWGVLIYIVMSTMLFNNYINNKLHGNYGDTSFKLFKEKENIKTFIRENNINKFVEFEDGILAFVTDIPSIGGLGPILDLEASVARKNGKFLELLNDRGYELIIASKDYGLVINDYIDNKRLAKLGLWGIKSSEFQNYSINKYVEDDNVMYYLLKQI